MIYFKLISTDKIGDYMYTNWITTRTMYCDCYSMPNISSCIAVEADSIRFLPGSSFFLMVYVLVLNMSVFS